MILGVTGCFCAGKDSLAAYLRKKGFERISLSDMIREEILSRELLRRAYVMLHHTLQILSLRGAVLWRRSNPKHARTNNAIASSPQNGSSQ
jgi:dephospho-CoA kinase